MPDNTKLINELEETIAQFPYPLAFDDDEQMDAESIKEGQHQYHRSCSLRAGRVLGQKLNYIGDLWAFQNPLGNIEITARFEYKSEPEVSDYPLVPDFNILFNYDKQRDSWQRMPDTRALVVFSTFDMAPEQPNRLANQPQPVQSWRDKLKVKHRLQPQKRLDEAIARFPYELHKTHRSSGSLEADVFRDARYSQEVWFEAGEFLDEPVYGVGEILSTQVRKQTLLAPMGSLQ